ncbi:MAG TPA: FAD-dependent oxidoreductase, partial [Bacteroidota bacterium]|nr:FAD-dependent oxidoreductase [Bacteroidota bacterium]
MGHGSSLHNAGYVSPSHFMPLAAPGVFKQGLKWMFNPRSPLYIKPRLNLDFLRWTWKFARACDEQTAMRSAPLLLELLLDSARLTREISRLANMQFALENRGIAVLSISDKGKQALGHEHELALRMGLDSRLLDGAGLQALDPEIDFRAVAGWFVQEDSHLVPATFVRNLAEYLAHRGCILRPNTEVTGIEASANRITGVRVGNETLEANEYVLASGAWSPIVVRKLGVKMFLEAGKGYSATFRNPKVKPTRPYIFQERRVAVTPFPDSLRFAGTMEIAGINLGLNMPRIDAILDAIPYYFGNIERPSASSGELWAGLRPVTPDGMPYIGRYKQFSNLIAATGHAMLGVSLSAVTGKLVSEITAGQRPSHDLTLLNPNRFD